MGISKIDIQETTISSETPDETFQEYSILYLNEGKSDEKCILQLEDGNVAYLENKEIVFSRIKDVITSEFERRSVRSLQAKTVQFTSKYSPQIKIKDRIGSLVEADSNPIKLKNDSELFCWSIMLGTTNSVY